MPSLFSTLLSTSNGSIPGRSHLFTKVITGTSRNLHTSKSFSVCSSTPFATSITIKPESAATKVRKVSSEKSLWPGVSNKLYFIPSFSKRMTEEVTEIPRSFSMAIQSEAA